MRLVFGYRAPNRRYALRPRTSAGRNVAAGASRWLPRPDADVRVMRSQIGRLRELVRERTALERELLGLIRTQQPRLLERKTRREAIRALKRHLVHAVYNAMTTPPTPTTP